MLAAVRSAAVIGIDAYDVTVEVDAAHGLPQWMLVGLPAGSVKESRERVSAALANSGFVLPPRRITVNLAPADVRKDGTAFDLPIALGVLIATGQLAAPAVAGIVAVGELGLDGSIRSVRGSLPVARRAARVPGTTLVVPPSNVAEAALVSSLRLAAPASLGELIAGLRRGVLDAPCPRPSLECTDREAIDFSDVIGQEGAKRALEIAAAGSHAALLIGPPGAGKTMLARRMPTILPALSEEERLEVIAIHSVAGLLAPSAPLPSSRPFRAPHHTLSAAALVGGGSTPRPGEASLAHHGVLFLDELQEIPRHVLDALRQPLEDGSVVISRSSSAVSFPSRFTLIGAMNPCPCGRAGDPRGGCVCTASEIVRHRGRLSGPMADRIDMHVQLAAVPLRDLGSRTAGESSAEIRMRVERARTAQTRRFAGHTRIRCNAHAPGRWLDTHTPIDGSARDLLASAAERCALSARGYHRVIRVARTIADLDGEEGVEWPHVAEALRYRPRGGESVEDASVRDAGFVVAPALVANATGA